MRSMMIILMASIAFSGCTRTEYVYQCPDVKVLRTVPKVDFNVTNGCVCDASMGNLINTAKMLRASETYYIDQIGKQKEAVSNE